MIHLIMVFCTIMQVCFHVKSLDKNSHSDSNVGSINSDTSPSLQIYNTNSITSSDIITYHQLTDNSWTRFVKEEAYPPASSYMKGTDNLLTPFLKEELYPTGSSYMKKATDNSWTPFPKEEVYPTASSYLKKADSIDDLNPLPSGDRYSALKSFSSKSLSIHYPKYIQSSQPNQNTHNKSASSKEDKKENRWSSSEIFVNASSALESEQTINTPGEIQKTFVEQTDDNSSVRDVNKIIREISNEFHALLSPSNENIDKDTSSNFVKHVYNSLHDFKNFKENKQSKKKINSSLYTYVPEVKPISNIKKKSQIGLFDILENYSNFHNKSIINTIYPSKQRVRRHSKKSTGNPNKNITPHSNKMNEVNVTNNPKNTTLTKSKRGKKRTRRGRRRHRRLRTKNLALWIDARQVKQFSGYMMEIFAIHNGRVLPYILDPNFDKHLPVIPFEVKGVNFTWKSGHRRYYYNFDRLVSHDEMLLEHPVVSLPIKGRVPKKPKVFTVNMHCTGNTSGIAAFDIGLLIKTRRGKPIPGTPLRLKLRKECTQPSPDPECDEKCENGGVCDAERRCKCPEGYMGQYCMTALCYPQCMNGGTCTTPGRCTCPPGYQGRHCEGGICRDRCENGGKCIQKDTCSCPRGYYGPRCEFSKCVIPCVNGGRCRNVNKCKCPQGFSGDHCEIVTGQNLVSAAIAKCSRKCRHGTCRGSSCHCHEGYNGRWCKKRGSNKRKRLWI